MQWIKDWKQKFRKGARQKMEETLLFMGVVAVMFLLKIPCPFLYLFKHPCAGCGMTRALLSAIHLNFRDAFAYHPMFWSVPPMLLCYWLNWEPFPQKWMNYVLFGLVLAGFVLIWVIRLVR